MEEAGKLKKKYKPDFIIANVENLTHGAGINPQSIEEMRLAGIDFFTGGNHSLENSRGLEVLNDPSILIIRPENFATKVPGIGHKIVEVNGVKVGIMNLLGTLLMNEGNYRNPFALAEELTGRFKKDGARIIILDFHCETTAEKAAMANYLDGEVSLIFGTHTHVPTADERVMPKGTGFITDIGFCGPYDSVIGVKTETVVNWFRYPEKNIKTHIEEEGRGIINAILVDIDVSSGKCLNIERINKIIK